MCLGHAPADIRTKPLPHYPLILGLKRQNRDAVLPERETNRTVVRRSVIFFLKAALFWKNE